LEVGPGTFADKEYMLLFPDGTTLFREKGIVRKITATKKSAIFFGKFQFYKISDSHGGGY
jgi:hypothetical protein